MELNELESLSYALSRAGLDSEVVLPEDVHVVLGNMRFHYLDWGGTGRTPVVFLHGGGLTAHSFDLVCLALRDDFRCLALDQRGHGDSEWSPVMDYTHATHARDLMAFVDHLGIERFTLAGMSMGGLNAIRFAGRSSSRLLGLILIDVGPNLQSSGTDRIQEFMNEPTELDSIDDFIERAVKFNRRRDPVTLRRSLLNNLRQTPSGKWTWKWDPRPRQQATYRQALTTRRVQLWEEISSIQCPTLVIRGSDSDVFSDADAMTVVERLRNGRLRIVENAGHSVQGDNPAGLVREIRAFLKDIA